MYHVELRQFPHNFCRFNLTEAELRAAVLDAWARGEWVEFGERKWNPQQAKLTVLEGPQIPLEQLSMGRGWSNAQRGGEDVTERVVAAVRAAGASLAEDLLALLGDDPTALLRAWQLALERHPDRTPSECLALAEALLRG